MISSEDKILLEGLRLTNYGKALQALLDEKYAELNNVNSCKSWEDTIGRQHAIKILDELFHFMKEKVKVENKTRYD